MVIKLRRTSTLILYYLDNLVCNYIVIQNPQGIVILHLVHIEELVRKLKVNVLLPFGAFAAAILKNEKCI